MIDPKDGSAVGFLHTYVVKTLSEPPLGLRIYDTIFIYRSNDSHDVLATPPSATTPPLPVCKEDLSSLLCSKS